MLTEDEAYAVCEFMVGDVISRQSAIETVPSAKSVDKDINVPANDTIYRQDLVDRRAVLHIIGNAFDNSVDFKSADYVRIRRQVEALPTAGRWIPCSKKLPKKDGDYYVTTHNGQIARFIFIKGASEEYWMRCALAWMPLLEPYKGKDGEQQVPSAQETHEERTETHACDL